MNFKQLKNRLKQPFMPFIYYCRRLFLKNTDFSIISNNCWGGFVYQHFGLEYRTPFIGLFINTPCYIKLLKNIDLIYEDLRFIQASESHYITNMKEADIYDKYPIGVLGADIEIHFLHYSNAEEARMKWEKRLRRLNRKNLLVKFNQTGFLPTLLAEFDQLPYKNKICFTAQEFPEIKSAIFLPRFRHENQVRFEHRYYRKHMNIAKYLNSMINEA